MMNLKYLLFAMLSCFLLSACNSDDDQAIDYAVGKNYYNITVDGDIREYYVHVPTIYNDNTRTPVVFMLHGTSGDGEKFYNISGWKEVAEDENIITIYPSSWRYCIIDDGQVKNTTKWNIFPAGWEYCANQVPRDDIKFLRAVLDETIDRFNVDESMVYLAGFSNGGAMAFRCAVEMGDVFSAIVESGGSYSGDSILVPYRNVPVTYQVGNSDSKWFGEGNTFPTEYFDSLVTTSPRMLRVIDAHTRTFDCEDFYSKSGDPATAQIANFQGKNSGNHEFNFVLISGLGHNYPNGNNHPILGASQNWQWMKQYSLIK
jgi:polyhydroxybutyrate depolymerase